MKPLMKIGSFMLAVVMLFTALFAAGCTPISMDKEWSYKTSDDELAIGVYIYSLYAAYNQAKTYAEKLDGYSEYNTDWLDKEITDDDENKQVAREWIKAQAKEMCLSYLVLEEQLKAENVEFGKDQLDAADKSAESNWNVGPYASYGYVMPMKTELEPYGISFESFAYCTGEYSAKYEALFKAVYNEGGSKAVSDAELTKYFTENYTDYSYLPVNLYTTETGEDGQQKNTAMSDADAKKVTDQLDKYAAEINGGKKFADVVKEYMTESKVESDPSTSAVEILDKSSIGDELKEAIKKLDANKASTLKVGSGETAIYYLVFKGNINNDVDEYVKKAENREGVLANMKTEEFSDYIKELAGKVEAEENTSVIDKYQPEMFFVKPQPTTAAESSEDEESSAESDSSSKE